MTLTVHPMHVGKTVAVLEKGQKIFVRSKDLIIAEHNVAQHKGDRVTSPDFLADLWKLTLATQDAPVPNWQMTFRDNVASTPLSLYDAVEHTECISRPSVQSSTECISRPSEGCLRPDCLQDCKEVAA